MSHEPPPFRARFPWWGGDLQTVANSLRRRGNDLPVGGRESLAVALPDGSGDALVCTLNRPETARPGSPLVILIHGLTGTQDSTYVCSMARTMLERGHRVLRINLRGAGPSRALCKGQYYAGRSQDFRDLLATLPHELTRAGVVAVGYSLGGAMLLKYLGEEGSAARLDAAASVCAPIDLSVTCRNMMRSRNALYHRLILRQMKAEATAVGALLTEKERAAILDARSVWHYDDEFIAPRHGFDGAEDYYERCKPLRFMGGIRVPTLVLGAMDDPWIPGRLYRSYEWAANPALTALLPAHGGHVGFHGTGSLKPWSDTAIAGFFEHG